MKAKKSKLKTNASAFAIFLFVVLTVYVISKMFMYAWGFYTSLKTEYDLMLSSVSFPKGMPWDWAWENYSIVFENLKIPNVQQQDLTTRTVYLEELLLNTLLYTIVGTAVNAFTTWLVAYLMVRFRNIKLNALLYTVNIALMTIPVYGTLPAALRTFKFFNWYNNYSFYIFNNLAFTGTNLLYFHAFINGLGREYYEAAYVDGAGNFTIMMKITFPLTQGMFWVFFLTGAIGRWNDYSVPIIWMPSYPTLGYALWYHTTGDGATETVMSFLPQQTAYCMVLMLPLMILFFAFQDKMLGNLRIGGIKG